MTETDYVPAAQVPELEQLRADMKKAKDEHPEYGSCPNCIKAVRVDKYGRLRDHNTPELASGNLKATFRCPGSGKGYAEYGDFGETWDLKAGRWVELDVDVPVLFVAHDLAAEKGVELPLWQLCGIRPAGEHIRRAAKILLDGTKWRIELVFAGHDVAAHLVRLNAGLVADPIVWETQLDEAAYGGTERVIEKLIARLLAVDETDAAQAAAHG